MSVNVHKKVIFLTVLLALLVSGSVSAQHKINDLKFAEPVDADSDASRTLQSLTKVQGTGGLYQDGLYLMTHYGDRQELFKEENQRAIDDPWICDTWRYCSVFSNRTENSVIMGRNWDNQNVGSIIVNLYRPVDGYASISFCRAIDLGYPLNMDLEEIKSSDLGNKLLLAPFYATDGINEHGLTVAVTGVDQTNHQAANDKDLVFVTFLVRKILDHAKNIDDAVVLAEKYVPFDLDRNSLNTHFYIVDSSGRSVILEYADNEWEKTYGDEYWQVLTNKSIFDVLESDLRDKCWRYKSISETLESEPRVGWKTGMKILQDVSQKGTTWSVVYSASTEELYFSVYQNWDTIYHLSLP